MSKALAGARWFHSKGQADGARDRGMPYAVFMALPAWAKIAWSLGWGQQAGTKPLLLNQAFAPYERAGLKLERTLVLSAAPALPAETSVARAFKKFHNQGAKRG